MKIAAPSTGSGPVCIRVNRNALRATGPRTPEGKNTSSRNAIKHGLTARQVVIKGENQEDFDALLASITADRKPEGQLEIEIAGEIAACTWRLARARQCESTTLEIDPDIFFADRSPGFDRLLRYMGAIERQLNRAAVRLQQIQAERRKNAAPAQSALAPTPPKPLTMAAGSANPSTYATPEFVSSNPLPASPIAQTVLRPTS